MIDDREMTELLNLVDKLDKMIDQHGDEYQRIAESKFGPCVRSRQVFALCHLVAKGELL